MGPTILLMHHSDLFTIKLTPLSQLLSCKIVLVLVQLQTQAIAIPTWDYVTPPNRTTDSISEF